MKYIVPAYYLYGEPHRIAEDRFVHAEALDERSRPGGWTIKPHFHTELLHLILIDRGGGAMNADGCEIEFASPCFLLIPPATIHGFRWQEETSGSVITLAARHIADLSGQDTTLETLFNRPAAISLDRERGKAALWLIHELMRELAWFAPGHRAAVNALLLQVSVLILRNADRGLQPSAPPGQRMSTIIRLKERIEQRFRLRESVASYAAALGVSETALRTACAKIAGISPTEMLDQRTLLEAKRVLLHSNLSIAEVGFSIGFSDPAYFSRFFTRKVGMSPKRYREALDGWMRQA